MIVPKMRKEGNAEDTMVLTAMVVQNVHPRKCLSTCPAQWARSENSNNQTADLSFATVRGNS